MSTTFIVHLVLSWADGLIMIDTVLDLNGGRRGLPDLSALSLQKDIHTEEPHSSESRCSALERASLLSRRLWYITSDALPLQLLVVPQSLSPLFGRRLGREKVLGRMEHVLSRDVSSIGRRDPPSGFRLEPVEAEVFLDLRWAETAGVNNGFVLAVDGAEDAVVAEGDDAFRVEDQTVQYVIYRHAIAICLRGWGWGPAGVLPICDQSRGRPRE